MDDDDQGRERDAGAVEEFGGPFDQRLIRLHCVGQQLMDGELTATQIEEGEVGKSAANVDAEGVSLFFQTVRAVPSRLPGRRTISS